MATKIAKTLLVLGFGLYVLLVAINNVDDYNSNYQFVRHVLSMDTTFPGNDGMYRALTSTSLHSFAYLTIIATEWVTAVLLLGAAALMARGVLTGFRHYSVGKSAATIGLGLAFSLWFIGFIAIGGEWFLMWQSQTWNGIGTSFNIVEVALIILLFVTTAPDEPQL